ncbi:Rad9 family protein [Cryptosporidium felis]|nr:Rad9 family protein [Cryptosporidium felis]
MAYLVEGDGGLIKQLNNCLSCLLRGFKCQDVLVKVTKEHLMLYSFPIGGISSCFQFIFDERLFDRFEAGEGEFEQLYSVASLLNCFNNTQWLKANRFVLKVLCAEDDALEVTVLGKNGIVRTHQVSPVTGGPQGRIFLHEKVFWNRRHGIRVSSGLLKEIFGYMEIRESVMNLSIDAEESLISFKVQPIEGPGGGCGGPLLPGVGGPGAPAPGGGGGTSNSSTYQDFQIKREQIETLSVSEEISANNSFTFNSREFKVAIALAENCQLPVFLTLRGPGYPLIVSIGQRAVIDQMCVSDKDGPGIPFEYHWEKPLFQTKLFQMDCEYIEKTQFLSGFSAVFLLSTVPSQDPGGEGLLEFNSSAEEPQSSQDPDSPSPEPPESQSSHLAKLRLHEPSSGPLPENCSFLRLDRFSLESLFQELGVPDETAPESQAELPPADRGVETFDWISTLMW